MSIPSVWRANIYFNNGRGQFSSGVPFGAADNTRSLAIGDLNGDGALDIILGNGDYYTHQASKVYLNDGQGGFGAGVPFGDAHDTRSIAVGDLNGDGALDIVQANAFEQSMVYLNDGQGGFSVGMPFGPPNYARGIAFGDVNGDGALDIVKATTGSPARCT